MRSIVLLMAVMVLTGAPVFAEMKMDASSAPVEVANKICPISGHEVGEMGEPVKVEYKGKTYSLCCTMCKKDFDKDPEGTVAKIEESMKAEGVAATN